MKLLLETFMIRLLVVGLFLVPHVSLADGPGAPPEPADMRPIFNGNDLTGWDGDPRLWSVRDGAIRGETTEQNPATGNTFIIWQGGKTRDFDLRLSFRANATNNSGIQYRSKHIRDGNPPNSWVVRGYQHEIRNELRLPDVAGFIYDEGASGVAFALSAKRPYGCPMEKKSSATRSSTRRASRSYSGSTIGIRW
jgi:hypothetical protein